jgi:excisionase family DNA binding protein
MEVDDAPTEPDFMLEPPSVLTVDEVARLLRVNRKTLYELIARGVLPGAHRIGRHFRVHREAVLDWLRGQDRVVRARRTK